MTKIVWWFKRFFAVEKIEKIAKNEPMVGQWSNWKHGQKMMTSEKPSATGKSIQRIDLDDHTILLDKCSIMVHLEHWCISMNRWKVMEDMLSDLVFVIVDVGIFSGCSKVIQVASAGLFVDVKYHEPLFAVIKYLPECALFGRGDHIGGVQFNNEPSLSWLSFDSECKTKSGFSFDSRRGQSSTSCRSIESKKYSHRTSGNRHGTIDWEIRRRTLSTD